MTATIAQQQEAALRPLKLTALIGNGSVRLNVGGRLWKRPIPGAGLRRCPGRIEGASSSRLAAWLGPEVLSNCCGDRRPHL